ncbi:probable inactive poly [ADP-ribose] polymerase SRO2 isoform X2 [Durio zibethinus]|uniref:Probable inactive poly [ADP-ribose] polymerase SRO2 isoform X2 n=1 Tax=Durio zibethinus TaxID=66656 RepID=A0A6P5XGK7_DURZI|nr:probable inactive poly [ADP-ribose] polymerase SRO2 isoform X2 [Durio zibethinus]
MVVEDQVSGTIVNEEIPDATFESTEVDSGFRFFVENGFANKIRKSTSEDSIIRASFFSGMGQNLGLVEKTKIVAIHKNLNPSCSGKVRAQSFQVFAKAVADKRGGDANLKYAWYGASRDEICEILIHGFSWYRKAAGNIDCSRRCISLSPAKFSFDSVLSSEVDETGLRHLLLCRVILGKQEVVTDSNQFHPSSPEFDSGVDDLSAPRKYIVWSAYMNSHILPCYIISFEAPYLRDSKGLLEANTIQPRSPWMSFPKLISMLSRFLGPSDMASLNKQYADFQEKKITRPQLIQSVKEIAGNQLLAAVVNLYINESAGTSS